MSVYVPEVYVCQLLQHAKLQGEAGQLVKPQVDVRNRVLQLHNPEDQAETHSNLSNIITTTVLLYLTFSINGFVVTFRSGVILLTLRVFPA